MASTEPAHHYHFDITMTCGGCSGAVERVLKKTEGRALFPFLTPSLPRVFYVPCFGPPLPRCPFVRPSVRSSVRSFVRSSLPPPPPPPPPQPPARHPPADEAPQASPPTPSTSRPRPRTSTPTPSPLPPCSRRSRRRARRSGGPRRTGRGWVFEPGGGGEEGKGVGVWFGLGWFGWEGRGGEGRG